jgi:hypothetical protein
VAGLGSIDWSKEKGGIRTGRCGVGRTETYGSSEDSEASRSVCAWSHIRRSFDSSRSQSEPCSHRISNLGDADGRCKSNSRVARSTSSIVSSGTDPGRDCHTIATQVSNFSEFSASLSDFIISTLRTPRVVEKSMPNADLSSKCQ